MESGSGREDSAFCFRHVEFAVSIGHLQFYRQLGNIDLKLREIVNFALFFYFLATRCSMRDPFSLTRDRTSPPRPLDHQGSPEK